MSNICGVILGLMSGFSLIDQVKEWKRLCLLLTRLIDYRWEPWTLGEGVAVGGLDPTPWSYPTGMCSVSTPRLPGPPPLGPPTRLGRWVDLTLVRWGTSSPVRGSHPTPTPTPQLSHARPVQRPWWGVRWTPSFGPKSGVAKVEPAGSVLVVVVSCELGCRPGPGTRNGPTPVRGDGVQVAAGAPRSGVGAERRTWRRSSTPAPGAEAARALMRRGTSTSSRRTRPASDSPTTYAVARHCRSGSSARFPRAPRSANHRGAGRSPQT